MKPQEITEEDDSTSKGVMPASPAHAHTTPTGVSILAARNDYVNPARISSNRTSMTMTRPASRRSKRGGINKQRASANDTIEDPNIRYARAIERNLARDDGLIDYLGRLKEEQQALQQQRQHQKHQETQYSTEASTATSSSSFDADSHSHRSMRSHDIDARVRQIDIESDFLLNPTPKARTVSPANMFDVTVASYKGTKTKGRVPDLLFDAPIAATYDDESPFSASDENTNKINNRLLSIDFPDTSTRNENYTHQEWMESERGKQGNPEERKFNDHENSEFPFPMLQAYRESSYYDGHGDKEYQRKILRRVIIVFVTLFGSLAVLLSSVGFEARGTSHSKSDSNVEKVQREILVDFYNAANGDGWEQQWGWNGDKSTCEWHGISCSESGNVIAIEMGRNNLVGTISAQLGKLSELRVLDLSENTLSNSIPPELAKASELRELYLFDNELKSSIPSEFGNLFLLQTLSLTYNSLSSSIPNELFGLSNLNSLDLGDNDLSGSINGKIGGLQGLKELYLYENSFTASVPSELGGLSNLKYLFLQHNKFSGQVPSELGMLYEMKEALLYANEISGEVPNDVCPLLDKDVGSLMRLSVDCESSKVTCDCCTGCA